MKSLFIAFLGVMLLFHTATEKFKPSSDALFASIIAPQMDLQLTQQDSAAKKLFIAIYSLGPSWKTDKPAHEQIYFKEHGENLKKLRTDKKILLGARYSDKGMIILAATDEKEARAMLENDPMVVNKVFNLELYPFSPFYKGCIQ
jgi:uncharacterized protein YciI